MSSRRRMQSGDERDKLGMEVEGGGGQQQDNGLEVEQEEDGQVTANDELLSPESGGRMEKRRMARVIVAEQDDGTPKQTATEQDLGSRSSRIAGRGVLPCDDDANGVFPCPVFDCDLPPFDNRAIRNYHLRTEHSGYLYTSGDYERKMAGRPPEEVHQRSKPRQKTMSGSRIQKEANKMFDMPLDLQEDVKPKDALNIGYDSGYSLFENQRGNPLGQSSSRFSPMSMSDRQAMQVQTEQLPMNSNNRNYTIGEQYSPHEIQVGAEEIYTMEETMYETEQILNEDYEKMDEEDRKMMDAFYPHVVSHHSRLNILRNKRRGRPKNEEGQEPGPTSKIRIGDPNGKYGCYVKSCPWRGGYRSIRAAHMKWCHKDWVMPSRFLLQRMSREATMIAPGHVNIEPEPEFSCLVAGCPWKGNYRATRAAHMRTHHPNYEYPKKKASVGGYIPDGKYMCHISGCEWRGSSRSTRATHMRKAHPGVRTQQYSARTVACADCELQCNSHKHFVDHMAIEHHIGGIVQREFTDIRDYEEWFGAVQEAFSIEFVRRMSIKQTEHYQVMYMYCTRSGGYRPRRIRQTEPYMPEYTKRRTVRSKVGKNCAAFLRIVHWTDSHITVVGCIEHTGHRMGTSLLRLSPLEREVLDEYLYVWQEDAPLDMALERLREMDGYSIEGYEATEKTVEDVKQFMQDENELLSLDKLVKGQLKDSVFGVNLVDENGEVLSSNFSVGIMSPHMKDLWIKHSHRAVCIEEVHLMLGGKWDVSLYFVMVFDEREIPRCAAIYLSSVSDHEKLLRNLSGIYEGGSQLDTFVTDGSQEWVQAFTNVFGNKAYTMDLQIAEWHVLSDWTVHCDYLVPNKIDKFQILCVLRRWLRTTDMPMFEAIVVDLFEALREMELDELLAYLDSQLIDPDIAKRWIPLQRDSLTDHSNPTLEVTTRILREKFLNCDFCTRVDEYVGLLVGRIQEFNSAQPSNVFTTKPPDPPRGLPPPIFDDIDTHQILADGSVLVDVDEAENVSHSDARMRQRQMGHDDDQRDYGEEEMIVVNMDELIHEHANGNPEEQYEQVIVIEEGHSGPEQQQEEIDILQEDRNAAENVEEAEEMIEVEMQEEGAEQEK